MNRMIFALVFVAMVSFASACDSTLNFSADPLDQPNHIYCMTRNGGTGNFKSVAATNITVDCQGWSVNAGFNTEPNASGAHIQNCYLTLDTAYSYALDFYSDNNTITNISGNGIGILLSSANNNIATNLKSSPTYRMMITLVNSSNNKISNSDVATISMDGITNNNIINNVTIIGADYVDFEQGALILLSSNNNTISNSIVVCVDRTWKCNALYLKSSNNNTISKSHFISNDYAIHFVSSNNNNITNDGAPYESTALSYSIDNGDDAIHLVTSNYNTISNSLSESRTNGSAIYIERSVGNVISKVTAVNHVNSTQHSGLCPAIYIISSNYTTISDTNVLSNFSGIYMMSSYNNIIDYSSINMGLGSNRGILIDGSSNIISNSNITSKSSYGVRITGPSNIITNNHISGKNNSYGAVSITSNNNIITNNTINTNLGAAGVQLSNGAGNNTIVNNTVFNGTFLIVLDSSTSSNTICWNNFSLYNSGGVEAGYYIHDDASGNYYSGQSECNGEGNIYYEVMQGDLDISGTSVSTGFPWLKIGDNGTNYPYSEATSRRVVHSGVIDNAPLVHTTGHLIVLAGIGGTATGNATLIIPDGSPIDAYPDYSYSFLGWTSTGDCTIDDISFTNTRANVNSGTCTVTASFIENTTGDLIVIKQVISQNGSATANQFNIRVLWNGTDVSGSPLPGSETGNNYILPSGEYQVSEDIGYGTFTSSFSGNCDSNGNVVISSGSSTCFITNTENALSFYDACVSNYTQYGANRSYIERYVQCSMGRIVGNSEVGGLFLGLMIGGLLIAFVLLQNTRIEGKMAVIIPIIVLVSIWAGWIVYLLGIILGLMLFWAISRVINR